MSRISQRSADSRDERQGCVPTQYNHTMLLRSLAALAVLCSLPLLAEKKPVTLESISARNPRAEAGGPPTWAPDGKRFIYTKGKQVMLYDVPARSEKELFSLDPLEAAAVKTDEPKGFDWTNRRVAEQQIQWSPSGKELLISVKGDVFLWRFDTGKWDQLTTTSVAERDAKLSPDGTHVAFRREHDLYVLDVATRAVTRLTDSGSSTLLNGELDWVYPEELDLGTAFWWSPDSRSIAYMQLDSGREMIYPQSDLTGLRATAEPERYPQAGTPNAIVRVGVVAAKGGPTRWMDLGDRTDQLIARVWWTPDSAALAIERLNRVQNQLELLRTDASTGASKVLIHEEDRYWINHADKIDYLKDGRFLWPSERDGFRHLYLYAPDGKLIRQLTKGNWQVTELAGVDESRGVVYIVSTEASPVERQFYSLPLAGGAMHRITQTPGTHTISMGPTAEYYLDTYSSLTSPTRRTLHTASGAEWAVYREADRKVLDEYEILPTEIVTVKAADGTMFYARLIKPAGFEAGMKYPAIVMVYGGPGAQTVRDSWSGATWDQALAHRGFAIWQLDNRGSAGRGHAFETPLYHQTGRTELADQREGINWLIAQGFVDPARIGLYGWSYGGYMTLYSVLNAPDVFRAAIAGAPVTSWRNYDTIYTERYMGLPEENPEGYKKSSPQEYAANLKTRLLMVHNFEDDNVLFQNTIQMTTAFERAGKLFDMIVYPQKAHGVTGPLRRHLLEKCTDFFEKNLK
jgi:dipeptidyl-peptidase-4